jgi:hypothetical protein
LVKLTIVLAREPGGVIGKMVCGARQETSISYSPYEHTRIIASIIKNII